MSDHLMILSERFVELVRRYLALVESLPGSTEKDFLVECAIVLPQIYSLGQQLPNVELPEDDSLEINISEIKASVDPFGSPFGRIRDLLGEHDLYHEVFDPVTDTDAITQTLSDDLSDIYGDLKRPLIKYDSGEESEQLSAIWDWKFTLQIHWGNHLVGALRPIHRLIYDYLDSEVENEQGDA